jgi:polyhydroxyalkanoate synthase
MTAPEIAADSIGGPNPVIGLRRKDLLDSVETVLNEAVRDSRHTTASLASLARAAVDIARGRTSLRPGAKDRRFADSAWSENFLYRALMQFHLAAEAEVDSWLGGTQLSEVDRGRAGFVLSLALGALAPSNLPISPVAIKRFVDTCGTSAISGLRQFVADLRTNGGLPRQVDPDGFRVGRDIAATEGAVVYRNEVLELIQYTPRTEHVLHRPLLVVPPQINKYYVFDLSAGKSLVRHALDGGVQVFVVSWRNPTAEHRNWDLSTYLGAVERALAAIIAITGADDVNLLGACSGGITSVTLAAYLAAQDRPLINALTLLVSVFDTAEDHTLLGIFASEETLTAAKRRSHAAGVLDGRDLARVFNLLRPNDLIWSYWVNNYLLGNKPPAFDVLYWNNDTTRLPAALHSQLIDIYRDNSLAAGAVTVDGLPIDVGKITCDVFVTGGTTDHITPWEACYRSATRLGGTVEFVLSNAGHIQSILNPPGNPKATCYVNPDLPASAKEWRAGATEVAGSWWPRWLDWLTARSGDRKPAPAILGDDIYPPSVPAPGTYVLG